MTDSELTPRDGHEVARVWAGTAATFALATDAERARQYVAFYDAERRLTLAGRDLGGEWTVEARPEERVAWDAHNGLVVGVDETGRVHVAGNVHSDPLVYYRTAAPGDPTTLERASMVGDREAAVTYPQFHRTDDGLVFAYRDGVSGGGDWLWNRYDAASRTWERLLDGPLLRGGDAANAYPWGPVRGPEGEFHLCWVWRDTPDAATNHDLSYARSADLRTWTTAAGDPVSLPVEPGDADVVDPVPPGGGLINGNTTIGFDADGRPVLSYHKHDDDGTNLYVARPAGDGWERRRVSAWDARWSFGGRGSIPFDVVVHPARVVDGRLVQPYDHAEHGTGRYVLDADLDVVAHDGAWHRYPPALDAPALDHPDAQVNWVEESVGDAVYALRWESLGPNRDRERESAPDPTPLELYAFD